MAVEEERIKAVASWGFLGAPGGEGESIIQIIEGPIEITMETDEIILEIN